MTVVLFVNRDSLEYLCEKTNCSPRPAKGECKWRRRNQSAQCAILAFPIEAAAMWSVVMRLVKVGSECRKHNFHGSGEYSTPVLPRTNQWLGS